jgi:hypothetical protein
VSDLRYKVIPCDHEEGVQISDELKQEWVFPDDCVELLNDSVEEIAKLKSEIVDLRRENAELEKERDIRDLEQQQLAVTRFANKYCGDCTTGYQVRLSAESMMYCKRLEALKESK